MFVNTNAIYANCKKCGLENAPHSRDKNRPSGHQWCCKMCCSEMNAFRPRDLQYERQKLKNRLAKPGAREKLNKRRNAYETKRRLRDSEYRASRNEASRKWDEANPDKVKARREAYNKKRRDVRAARTDLQKEAARLNQKIGNLSVRGYHGEANLLQAKLWEMEKQIRNESMEKSRLLCPANG